MTIQWQSPSLMVQPTNMQRHSYSHHPCTYSINPITDMNTHILPAIINNAIVIPVIRLNIRSLIIQTYAPLIINHALRQIYTLYVCPQICIITYKRYMKSVIMNGPNIGICITHAQSNYDNYRNDTILL